MRRPPMLPRQQQRMAASQKKPSLRKRRTSQLPSVSPTCLASFPPNSLSSLSLPTLDLCPSDPYLPVPALRHLPSLQAKARDQQRRLLRPSWLLLLRTCQASSVAAFLCFRTRNQARKPSTLNWRALDQWKSQLRPLLLEQERPQAPMACKWTEKRQ